MQLGAWTFLEWLVLIERELLLFAGFFFLIGALDEFLVDLCWLGLRLSGRAKTDRVERWQWHARPLTGRAAVFVPAWQEAAVIGAMVGHTLRAWPQGDVTIYVGCYRNDPATLEAAAAVAADDSRVRLVILGRDGPTTKADCLNRLYAAMQLDEQRSGQPCRMVVLQDAEDLVDPAAIRLMDEALDEADYVQLPVLPLPQPLSRWVGSHYCEEFAEAHGKAMVVRQALSAALPAAGVGCAFRRDMLARIAPLAALSRPFSVQSLTEDYELGMRIKDAGGKACFLRVRGDDGRLVATRAWFPPTLGQSVRQKARWVHGIAFQGWDRLGWRGDLCERWMRLRDRRGPLSALILLCAYLLLALGAVLALAQAMDFGPAWQASPLLHWLITANLIGFAWRAVVRFAFAAREYGLREGLRAVARMPIANLIAILAARRALFAYLRTLAGNPAQWDKTTHDSHPAASPATGVFAR